MSVLATHLSASPDIRPDRFPPIGSQERLPMPEIRESSPSPGPTRAPSPTPPQDHHRLTDPGLDPTRPDSAASIASSDTLSGAPLSPGAVPNTILGGPLVAEPESTSTEGRKHGAVWLAPSPVSFFTSTRYSRRDKLYVTFKCRSLSVSHSAHTRNYDNVKVIDTIPPLNGIEHR